MKTTFDIDNILYGILSKSPLKNAISGGIYKEGDRPVDSMDEDMIINNITLTQDHHPQLGVSNVNIYVPDIYIETKRGRQTAQNRKRLCVLTEMAIRVLRFAKVYGFTLTVEEQTILRESEIEQHYVNIRISWNIQN